MQSVVAWVEAHPVLFTAVVWPLVTTVASLVYRRLEAWPRTQGFMRALAGAGFDLPKILTSLHRVITGGKTPPPSSGSVAAAKLTGGAVLVACALWVASALSGCAWLQEKGPMVAPAAADLAVCVIEHADQPIEVIVRQCGGDAIDVAKILMAHRRAIASAAHCPPDGGP